MDSNKNLVAIYGAGSHGRVAADAAQSAGMSVVAFIDDGARVREIAGTPVVTLEDFRRQWPTVPVGLGIGDNGARAKVAERLKGLEIGIVPIVHAHASVSPSARIEPGVVVFAQAVVNAGAVVRRGAIVNSAAVVEHDCVVGAFAHIAPRVALGGNVTVGDFALVGIGASVLRGLKIGACVRVGGGAVVVRDVADDLTVVGVPATRLLKEKP